MKIFLSVLILIFSFQSWTKADDIRELEIEGVSIGDSLMKHMTIEKYNEFNKTQYEYIHTFATIKVKVNNLNLYDQVRAYYKINDKNKIIHSVEGNSLTSSIEQCKDLMNEVTNELDKNYKKYKNDLNIFDHWADKSKNSKVYQIEYLFKSGDSIAIQCVDWSKNMEDKNRWFDSFRVTLFNKETIDFLISLN